MSTPKEDRIVLIGLIVLVALVVGVVVGVIAYNNHEASQDLAARIAYSNSAKGQADLKNELLYEAQQKQAKEDARVQKLVNQAVDEYDAVPVRVVP
jgi:uncharacterized membrane protein